MAVLQYNMSLSTIVMPCNTSGPLDPTFFSQFGIVGTRSSPFARHL